MYQTILKTHLERRQQANPSYSMRCFARDLEIPSSHMSKILRGLQGMSESRAKQICEKLRLEGDDQQFFVDLVLACDARSKKGKLEARRRLIRQFPDRVPKFH